MIRTPPRRGDLLLAGPILLTAACMSPLQRVASKLDDAERYLEEWGSVSVSGALYVPDPDRFALEYGRSIEEHILAAQTQLHAGVASSIETVRETRSATSVQDGLAEPGETSAADPPTVTVASTFTGDQFAEPQALLGDTEYTIPWTDAIRAGYSSKFQEELLEFLANPGQLSHGEKLHLVVTQVSCSPGWRTRTDYIADVRVSVDNASARRKRGVDQAGPTAPVRVAAVFPLIETQNLDLRSSLRDQLALLGSLSAVMQQSGLAAQSSTISEYAERLQRDAATRTVQPVISSSVSEGSFGYQFRPVFRAIDDLTDPQSQGEYVLNPVSFPVLALIVTTGNDVETISLSADVNWYRAERPGFWSRLTEDLTFPFYHLVGAESGTPPRSTVVDRTCRLEALDWAHGALTDLDAKLTRGDDAVRQQTETDWNTTSQSYALAALWEKLISLTEAYGAGPQFLKVYSESAPAPVASAPKILNVYPARGPSNRSLEMIVHGSGFRSGTKGVVRSVTVSGRQCTFEVFSDTVLRATVPPHGDAGPDDVLPPQTVVVATAAGVAVSDNGLALDPAMADRWPVIPRRPRPRGPCRRVAYRPRQPRGLCRAAPTAAGGARRATRGWRRHRTGVWHERVASRDVDGATALTNQEIPMTQVGGGVLRDWARHRARHALLREVWSNPWRSSRSSPTLGQLRTGSRPGCVDAGDGQ